MNPKIKNAIIFISIGIVMILIYIFFIKKDTPQSNLVTETSSSNVGAVQVAGLSEEDSEIAKNFLSLLLSVKNIKIEDSIFSDPAFVGLRDSSISLNPDGTEGRPNPFAPVGVESSFVSNTATLNTFKPTSTTAPVPGFLETIPKTDTTPTN